MIFDLHARLGLTFWGCLPACASLALTVRGLDPNPLYADLDRTLEPEGHGDAAFVEVAALIRKHYRVFALAGIDQDLRRVLALVDGNAVVLGVDGGLLFGRSRARHHAVYVSAADTAAPPCSWIGRECSTGLRFDPPVRIIDPDRALPERLDWDFDDLVRAFTGRFLAIPLR